MDIATDLKWLRGHLISLVVVVALVLGSIYGIESIIAGHDAANNSKWQELLKTQQAETKVLSERLDQNEARWAQQNAAEQATINRLAAAITERDRKTAEIIKIDSTLSATDTAQKLKEQTHSNEISTNGDTVVLGIAPARLVVQSLDLLPAVQSDLADSRQQIISETTIAGNLQDDVNAKADLITAMEAQAKTQGSACEAQTAALKADARKGKLKWFAIGFGAGLATRILGRF